MARKKKLTPRTFIRDLRGLLRDTGHPENKQELQNLWFDDNFQSRLFGYLLKEFSRESIIALMNNHEDFEEIINKYWKEDAE